MKNELIKILQLKSTPWTNINREKFNVKSILISILMVIVASIILTFLVQFIIIRRIEIIPIINTILPFLVFIVSQILEARDNGMEPRIRL